jgi:hypothetical protein
MRKSSAPFIVVWLALGTVLAFVSPCVAADTHVIMSTPQFTWTYNGRSSTDDGTPVIVDDLKIGDVVEIRVGDGMHGLITIKQLADVSPPESNQTKDPVLACGEDANAKPNAVLREIECGATSQFGAAFTGSMKLEVLNTFTSDTNFWCVIHQFGMTGTLKLKP